MGNRPAKRDEKIEKQRMMKKRLGMALSKNRKVVQDIFNL
jgi:hypothetical protein